MSTEQTPPQKKSWFSLFLKILFCVLAIVLVTFTIMANLGGSSDTLKQSIEDFVSENTAYKAEVTTLNSMTFFPDISFDFEATEFSDKTSGTVVMYLDKAQIAFGFWDVMASTGKIKALNIKKFKALAGTVLDKDLEIESIEIIDTVEGPRLEASGIIDKTPFEFSCGMDSQGLGKGKKYSFGNARDFDFRLDNVKVTGTLRGGRTTGLVFDHLEILSGDTKVASGAVGIVRNQNRFDARGELKFEAHKTDLKPDFQLEFIGGRISNIKGVVESADFHVEDFNKGSGYDQVMTVLEKAFGAKTNGTNPDLKLRINTLYKNDEPVGFYHAPAPLKGWRLDIDAIKPEPKTLSDTPQ